VSRYFSIVDVPRCVFLATISPSSLLSLLEYLLQAHHPILNIPTHLPHDLVRRPMIIRRPLTHITQPNMRNLRHQIFLRHTLHRRELFPERLPFDEVLMDDPRAVHGYLEPLGGDFAGNWSWGLEWKGCGGLYLGACLFIRSL